MYTEYNSDNVKNVIYGNPDDYKEEKPNKFLSMIWKILLVIIILIVGFILLIQLGVISFSSSIMPDAILLNQNEIGIKKGKSYQLVSTVLPENANNKQVIWTSSDPKIVSVNETTGYITGVNEGTATITVKTLINDISTDCVVNVTAKDVLISGISFYQKYISIAVGYTHTLSYSITPKNASSSDLSFTSSDPSVAIVNQQGVVKGLKEGNTIITVSARNGIVKDTTYVTVYKKGATTVVDGDPIKTTNYPKTITLDNTELNLKLGTTSQVIATVSPSDANQSVSWSSSNSRIATVDSNGLIKAVGIGSTTIIARTVNDLTASVKVTVGDYSLGVKSIMITTNYIVLPVGSAKRLVVAFTPANASNKTITWSSSNPSVATVDSSGNVKAISTGSTIIKATAADGGYTDTATIEVSSNKNEIEEKTIAFSESSYTVGVNATISLTPIITPSNATFKSVRFTSSDSSIATVDDNGVVKGIKEGTVNITAETYHNHLKATTTIIVKYIPVTSVKLNVSSEVTLKKGETTTIVATVLPSNASDKTVSYKSDNPNIATIDNNGIVNAKETGRATITITPKGGGTPATTIINVK